MDGTENFCAVYVDTELTHAELIKLISTSISGNTGGPVIESASAEIYVDRNDEYDTMRCEEFPDGFLFYRYRLEIGLKGSLQESVNFIRALLEVFWQHGFRAVAACDFEDQLPHRGGYRWDGNRR